MPDTVQVLVCALIILAVALWMIHGLVKKKDKDKDKRGPDA